MFTRACHDATGGNPLLLVELAKALRAEGVPPDAAHVAAVDAIAPRAASRAVLVRIGRLSRDAAAVARATAVLGDDAALPLVAELAGLDDAAAVAAAGELVGAEVFADQAAMAFVHPLIRAAVYEDIPVHERSLAHERAARLLRDRGAAAGAVATQLAARARSAARRGSSTSSSRRRAPRSARARPPAPRRYLTRALAEPPAAERRAQRAARARGARRSCCTRRPANEHLREALELIDDPIARGTAALLLARGLADEPPRRRGGRARPPHRGRAPAARPSCCSPRSRRCELTAPLFGASEPVAPERFAAPPAVAARAGRWGRSCSRRSPRTSGPSAAVRRPSARRWRWPRWRAGS